MNISKAIDFVGKILFAWIVYETCIYIFGGRMLVEINQIPQFYGHFSVWLSIYAIIKIPVAAFGGIIALIYLFKGRILGIIAGILYWVMGNIINPLWYIVPHDLQITTGGEATFLLYAMNISWSIAMITILIAFFLVRKKIRYEREQECSKNILSESCV